MSELPATEQQNPRSERLDEMSVESVLGLMNQEDRDVPGAVAEALPEIRSAVELLVESWLKGGRWIYVGAGTSGRIAALDAAECPPTFGAPADRILTLIAGGPQALLRAVEGAEDDRAAAVRDLEDLSPGSSDTVIGLAASGRTPYVTAAIDHARHAGCATVGVANNVGSELARLAQVGIEIPTGPEMITGSTRLKAGTSQKLVLNMLSTTAFTLLGKVYGNQMVDVQATNEKLRRRARRIVEQTLDVSESQAEDLLRSADGSVKVALIMAKANVSAKKAHRLLNDAAGSMRRSLAALE